MNCFGGSVKRASVESNTHGSVSPLLTADRNEVAELGLGDPRSDATAAWNGHSDTAYDDDQASMSSSIARRDLVCKLLANPNDETLL